MEYLSLPSDPGVYIFTDKAGKILYVGKAVNLKSRVSSYFTAQSGLGEKTKSLVNQVHKIRITIVESELEALLLEAYYIKKYNPRYNVKLTDNKSYIMVSITTTDKYPKVLITRKIHNPKDTYYGPFPQASSVKHVLRIIRKVFPFQSVINHPKKLCLYNHLGLCPCPPFYDSPAFYKQYKKNIKNILRIFEGQTKRLIKEYEKERDKLSAREMFEKASTYQQNINALSYITQPIHKPYEYEINPNLRTDLRTNELNTLINILNTNGCNIRNADKIECYDVSHIQGTNTVASMVVFVNGEKDASQYRKYKIRLEKTPDDFASMREVLQRRLKHDEWPFPDLIVVDGGKGQVSAGIDVLNKQNIKIPIIGLAKKKETIVIPQNISNYPDIKFKEINLPQDSVSLHLIMRLRDEAHRFAITYHRKLRSKKAIR